MPSRRHNRPPISYRDSGVDIDAGNALVEAIKPLAGSTRRPGAGADLGGFGALFDLKAAGFVDPILVAANDGVGTKLKIAIDTGQHDTIGIDLVAMCVNDLLAQGAEPLFFLDYFASGKLDVESARSVIAGIAEGCRQAGCALIGGETAEMPGMYAAGDYDLAGFAVGAVERGALLPRPDIAVGDVLIALPSSGVHSNGYSLVRRLVVEAKLGWDAPAPFAAATSLAEALLMPTRIYVRPVLQAIRATGAAKGLAHITGGGLVGEPAAHPAGGSRRAHRSRRLAGTGGVRLAAAGRQPRRRRDAAHLQLRHRHGRRGRAGERRGGVVRPARRRRSAGADRRHRARPRRQIGRQGQRRGRSRALFRRAGVCRIKASRRCCPRYPT